MGANAILICEAGADAIAVSDSAAKAGSAAVQSKERFAVAASKAFCRCEQSLLEDEDLDCLWQGGSFASDFVFSSGEVWHTTAHWATAAIRRIARRQTPDWEMRCINF